VWVGGQLTNISVGTCCLPLQVLLKMGTAASAGTLLPANNSNNTESHPGKLWILMTSNSVCRIYLNLKGVTVKQSEKFGQVMAP
jgi:hypothetical protein